MHNSVTLFFLVIVTIPFTTITAQVMPGMKRNEVPVFRSPQDSIRLDEVNAEIAECERRQLPDETCFKPLLEKRKKIIDEGVLRYRRIYSPTEGHTSFDSLALGKDLSTVKQLSISRRKLRKVPSSVLACSNLERLEIVNCRLRRIQKKLNRLDSLKTLVILGNTSSKPLILKKNSRIKILEIHGDSPASLPRAYTPFTALEKLDLQYNELTKFPEGTDQNEDLIELDLQHNRITLNEGIRQPHPHVHRLSLQYNAITAVPASIQQFANLERLSLNHNRITDIAAEISTLRKLQFLSLYNNQLSSIPWGLYELRELIAIDLYYNHIETVENKITNWSKLEVLYLSNNNILAIPAAVGALPVLEEFYAYNNRITTIPDTLGSLKRLKVLRLNENYIKTIPAALLRLDSLEELDLSRNYITDLDPAVFDYPNIQILALVNNPWSEQTRKIIIRKIPALRARDVRVLISERDGENQ